MESSASAGRVASAVLDPRRWWVLALLCGAFFMVLLDGSITIVALPSIGAGLRFSEQGLQWVLSAYALTFGGVLLLGGRAADLLGRRRVFMAGAVGAIAVPSRGRQPASGWPPRPAWRSWPRGRSCSRRSPVHGSYFPDIFIGLLLCGLGIGLALVTATVAALAGIAGLASGLSNTALQTGTALSVAIVTTVAVSRSQHYLAANNGANPLAALTQGYQSAFLACAVLAGIGLALAFLLPGRPRKPAHELPEPDPAADAAAAGDVVIRSGTK